MLVVSQLSRVDPDYYRILGPVFGSRRIAKEVGIHCYDDPNKVFYAARDGDVLCGLLSVNGKVISDCYVYPSKRRKGILTSLLSVAIQDGMSYRANCTPMSEGAFKKAGFTIKKKTKNFIFMELKNG